MSSKLHSQQSDQEILSQFYADHNNEWLGVLLERYTMLLYGVSMKYLKNPEEARDAVQQIFLKVITELHKYEVSYFSSWLYMIAKNHCLMHLRGQRKDVSFDMIPEPLETREDPDPIKTEKLKNELRDALRHLSREQKICVEKFYLEKKSYQTIASETGFNVSQVKSYIQNGKRNLKILLISKFENFDH